MRLLACILCLLLGAGTACAAEGALNPQEGLEYISTTTDLVLLDVRNPDELAPGSYPGALNIPVNELESRLREIPSGKPVLIYCVSGRRAKRAYDLLQAKRPDVAPLAFIKGAPIYPGKAQE